MRITNSYGGLVENFSPFRAGVISLDLTASGVAYVEADCPEDPVNSGEEELCYIDVKNNNPLRLKKFDFESVIIYPEMCITVETSEVITLDQKHWGMFYSVGTLNMANIAVIGSILIQPKYVGTLKITLRNFNKQHSYRFYKDQVIGQLMIASTGE